MSSSINSDLGIRLIFSIILLGSNLKSFEGAARDVENKTVFGVSKSEIEGTLNYGQYFDAEKFNDFQYEDKMQNDEEEESSDDLLGGYDSENEEIDSKPLIEMAKSMEKEAEEKPRAQQGILPKIYNLFGGTSMPEQKIDSTSTKIKSEKIQNIGPAYDHGNLPDDLSDKYFQDDVVDDIAAGIEESLVLSGGPNGNNNGKTEEAGENREYALYLFQGQYMVEPRLNRFIDGAIRNMVNEMKVEVMDPLYFRVLPRGQVVSRVNPRQSVKKTQLKLKPGRRRRRRRPFKIRKPGVRVRRRKIPKRFPKTLRLPKRGSNRNASNRNRAKQRKAQNRKRRQRNAIRGVGSGRVEGLSKIIRDGDAEMQLFGNYTMIRSHQRIGPVVINMQFRTRRGLRSTGATLPDLKVHTVTRVSPAGSEMVDFVLDRPHPEIIQLRGKLFPLAERVAKNIFARLFLPGSFLVQRIREKVGVSLLSKPRIGNDGY